MRNLPLIACFQFIGLGTAFADSCPAHLPLDQLLPGTTIELKETTDFGIKPDGNFPDQLPIFFVDGKPEEPSSGAVASERSVRIDFNRRKIREAEEKDFARGKIHKLKCTITPLPSKPDLAIVGRIPGGTSVFVFDSQCPIRDLIFYRAPFDPRQGPMDLAALKHNLGSDWVITPLCADQSTQDKSVNTALKKPSTATTAKTKQSTLPPTTTQAK